MKKLVFTIGTIVCAMLMSASYNADHKGISSSSSNVDSVSESLNGFLPPDAEQMVKNAQTDTAPVNTQIWFSKEVINDVFNLLRSDSAGVFKPDGIRIYFSTASQTDSNHFHNNIVVVSTFFDGVKTVSPTSSYNIHYDYFQHIKNAPLFGLTDIGGTISNDNDNTRGALLYGICHCDTIKPCVTSSDHDILRSEAEQMVQGFSPGGSFKATSEWFDIAMLGYLVNELNDTTQKEDGIRIYFARGTAGITNLDDVGKARFVIVPTQPAVMDPLTQKPIHMDYFDCRHPVTADMAFLGRTKRKTMGGGSDDNGEICPTHCPGTTMP